jgi:hypothetical protein
MMTKPHPHQDITKKGLIIPLITVLSIFIMQVVAQQSDKRGNTSKQIYFI